MVREEYCVLCEGNADTGQSGQKNHLFSGHCSCKLMMIMICGDGLHSSYSDVQSFDKLNNCACLYAAFMALSSKKVRALDDAWEVGP